MFSMFFFIKVKKTCFYVFFIRKVMFLTSMVYSASCLFHLHVNDWAMLLLYAK